ncbi:TraU family protein, partial [Legionella pneumophila serogroup 1]
MYFRVLLLTVLYLVSYQSSAKLCTGHFVNPITDVCWRCLFPLSIGNAKVVNSSLPDTENASSPIGVCPASTGVRLG